MMTTLYSYVRWIAACSVLALCLGPGLAGAEPGQIEVLPPGVGRAEVRGDSAHPRLEIREVTVAGRRVDLHEILRKAAEGEREKYTGLTSLSFTRRARFIIRFPGRKARTRINDVIRRVYFQAPDRWVEATVLDTAWVVLPDGTIRPPEDDDEDRVSIEADQRDIEALPFYLERLDKFRFFQGPIHRTDSTAVFEIGFEPVSDFASEVPGGRLWLLAPQYQIVREEFEFKNLPFAWALKDLDLLTREWQPIEDRWLEKRITGRADLRQNAVYRAVGLPDRIEFVLEYADYRLNPELSPAIFDRRGE